MSEQTVVGLEARALYLDSWGLSWGGRQDGMEVIEATWELGRG